MTRRTPNNLHVHGEDLSQLSIGLAKDIYVPVKNIKIMSLTAKVRVVTSPAAGALQSAKSTVSLSPAQTGNNSALRSTYKKLHFSGLNLNPDGSVSV